MYHMNKVIYLLLISFFTRSHAISQYFIAIKPNVGTLEYLLQDLSNFTPFIPPPNKYFADPVLFKHNRINYIFYEDFDYKKGRIAYVTIDQSLHLSDPKIILDLDYHVSFPFIFKEGNNIYMVPETSKVQEVALFEANPFPDHWKKIGVLAKGAPYADSILFKHAGYYWLFTANWTNLCIFYSTSLFSPFKAHPINIMKLQGRNAGNVFYYQGKLIRPVMNCEPTYGYSMTLKEIEELSPIVFREKEIIAITPIWAPNIDGTHTFNMNEDFIVYDGRKIVQQR